MYWNYFKYICEHKWNVFIEHLKILQPIAGITHDLSKYLPSEFIPYAKWFFGEYGNRFNGGHKWEFVEHAQVGNSFDMGWLLHQRRNKHHWNYWVNSEGKAIPMPSKYVMQMIADWRGMSRKFGGDTSGYYIKNKDTMILHQDTIEIIESVLLGCPLGGA